MQKRRRMWGWVFVAPQFIGLLIFALIPLVMSFVCSFHDWDGIADTMKFVGVKNYVHQVMDSDFQKALVNTVIYSIMYIPLNIVLALILALAVQKIKGKTLYRLFYFMPVVTGSVSVGVIWTWILNGDFGLLNSVLAVFGINGPKWLTDTHMVLLSIVIVSVWWNVGYNMVLLLAGLQNIPEVYYEAAEIDGANKWARFRNIHDSHAFSDFVFRIDQHNYQFFPGFRPGLRYDQGRSGKGKLYAGISYLPECFCGI